MMKVLLLLELCMSTTIVLVGQLCLFNSASAFRADLLINKIFPLKSTTDTSPTPWFLDQVFSIASQGFPPFFRVPRKCLPPIPTIILPIISPSPPLFYYDDYVASSLSTSIQLTKEEEELFELLKDFRDEYCPDTTLRVAGGWVRDKLLGIQETSTSRTTTTTTSKKDIDFVLSDKSGSDFAELFYEYLTEKKNDTTIINHDNESTNSVKIYGNNAQHLQTASLIVGGLEIDFVQLRYEKYSEESRIPEVTGIASVVEDAWRRDLTINSLFYNINTNQVEDWTENGLEDLHLRMIATPRAPLPTLLEDPLRILRAIRFAAQLTFWIHPDLVRAAQDQSIKDALQQKISRDRIGKEIDFIFRTNNPSRGVHFLIETNLMDVVFVVPDQDSRNKPCDTMESTASLWRSGFNVLLRAQALASQIFIEKAHWDESKRRYFWYAAFFQPCYNVLAYKGKQSRRHRSVIFQLLNSLDQPKTDIQAIERIIKGSNTFLTFFHDDDASHGHHQEQKLITEENTIKRKQKIGDLRWTYYQLLKKIGPHWKESLMLSLVQAGQHELFTSEDDVKRYTHTVSFIEEYLGLADNIHTNHRPLLDGSQVKAVLPGVKKDNHVGFRDIRMAQEEWQVRNLDFVVEEKGFSKTDQKDALISHLKRTFPEYATTTTRTKKKSEEKILKTLLQVR